MNFMLIERDNLSECIGLFISVFNNPPWNESWDIEAATEQLDDCLRTPGFYGILVQTDAKTVGFALGFIRPWDKSRHFHLKEMCVATEQQRRGVGTALLSELERQLRNQSVAKITLDTARETPAQAFYEGNGFSVSPRVVMMSKWLNPR